MIGQRAAALSERPDIYPYGCYLLCLCYLGWRHGQPDRHLGPQEILEVYHRARECGAMGAECYIRDPGHIVRGILGAPLTFRGYSAPRKLSRNEVAVECWEMARSPRERWRHFVTGDYDPWVRSVTRAQGTLVSLRVFEAAA